ncbi:DNA-3-methyladenine glycosylase I [Salinibacterium sp. UTAS2018]|uniref:DNA-3-methyladenine glycosylase I n=1 Tax=Salinibacterium sp. UTAS2018 TaxID=2508880 RepID=UPI0010094157|nr:DNA-3-methyladenine glycosylase I [Salinibacterium sp. UTAS2018]QAV69103.1 DNA-3-methyladenine glycosylase I [Salinibacterium sp. UTAS2018]
MSEREALITGPDSRARCSWVGDDEQYRDYHDTEWGNPMRGDHKLFEKIMLEAFQAGLSWITILRRREGIRDAFDQFDAAVIANYGDEDVARLLDDPRIIRNKLKVSAAITNAHATLELTRDDPGALDRLLWSFAPAPRTTRPATFADVPATTAESTAMSKALKARGFRFVGPTTMYALMQSAGMVDDHLKGCWRAS